MRTLPASLAQIEDRHFATQHGGLRPRFKWLDGFDDSLTDCLNEMQAAENWVSTRTDNDDTQRAHAIAAVSASNDQLQLV